MSRRFAVLCALAVMTAGLVPASPASAAVRCTFDPDAAVLRVDLSGDSNATLLRGPYNGILVNGNSCGATVFNTDRVRVVGDEGDQTLYLDLGGGRFGPGLTPEGTRYGEVEISFEGGRGTDEIDVWGTAHADHLVGSIAGFSLNADGDVDGWAWGLEAVKLFGLGGPDTLRVNGHGGDVSARGDDGSDLVTGYRFAERLSGGFGDDVIVGGDGNDVIDAGGGEDAVRAGDGNDRIRVLDAQVERRILCGAGTDTVTAWDAGDQGVATACENWIT